MRLFNSRLKNQYLANFTFAQWQSPYSVGLCNLTKTTEHCNDHTELEATKNLIWTESRKGTSNEQGIVSQ
jgi:hypothetical protein